MVEAISFQSMLNAVHVVRENLAVHLSRTELPWTRHSFDTETFFSESGMRRMRTQNEP